MFPPLYSSERHKRELMGLLPQLIWTCDAAGVCDYLNQSWVQFTGRPEAELLGFGWLDVIHPECRSRVHATWKEMLSQHGEVRCEYRIRRHDGVYRWFHMHAVPYGNEAEPRWIGTTTDTTEELLAREALRTERDRFSRIAAAVPGVIWVFCIKGEHSQMEYISEGAEAVLGCTREALMHDAYELMRLVHPDDRPNLMLQAAEALNRRSGYQAIYRARHPVRGEIWLEACVSPPEFCGDDEVRWHGYTTDVTRRCRAEQALRETEERFSVAFHASPGGQVLIRRDDDLIVEANDTVLRMLGRTREQLIGQRASEVCASTLMDTVPQLQTSLSQPVPLDNVELRFMRGDGNVVHAVASLNPVVIGGEAYALGHIADITERKHAEESLRDYRARLLTALESGGMSTWTCDLAGDHVWWDDTAPKLWGREREELMGGRLDLLLRFIHEEDRPLVARAFAELGALPHDWRVEFRNIRPDTRQQWMSLRAHVERDEHNVPYRLTGVCVDIDSRKRVEESQLASQKMEALGTLAGGIAHDFNNVLLAIVGNAQLAMSELPPGHESLLGLQEIQKASERARELVRRILTFSRQQETLRETIDLKPVIEEALGLLRPALPAMIDIRFAATAHLPVLANSTQLHQVLINLVANAAHAIGHRPGRIEICLDSLHVDAQLTDMIAADLRPGRHVRLSVSDTGSGMDRVTLTRIFDPFFTTKPQGQGTGLGLAVVHGIVKAHEGAITVTSEPEGGTCFCIYLPIAAQPLREPEILPPVRSPGGSGERVLYVDDDEAVAFLTARLLQRQGYELHPFTDALGALAAFRADPQRFDAVVTDLSMPMMSGFDLTREVLRVRPDIPVLMTSGYVRPEDQTEACAAGILEVILKPNTVEQLGDALDRALQALRAARGSSAASAGTGAHARLR